MFTSPIKQIYCLFFLSFFILIFFICFSQIILLADTNSNSSINLNGEFIWPLPGYTYISSYFGNRTSPTAGASNYHSGIDIPAAEGTPILSACSGKVTFASWGAGGGYTIVITNNNISVSYCHLSPTFLVSRGDNIIAGEIISKVGPKNVYGIINNPYKDSNGQPTNGATTRLSFTFSNKKRWYCYQSFKLFQYLI